MAPSCPPPHSPSSPSSAAVRSLYIPSTSICTIHPDILRTHILTRLDGPSLVLTSCTSAELNSLSSRDDLWASVCHSTWPSTNTPRMRGVISRFPSGPRSFFSHSFPLLLSGKGTPTPPPPNDDPPSELISAVDIHYRGALIFSKVVETETTSGWFRCSPFRIDMLEPKDTCRTPILHPESVEMCQKLADDLTLSWIVVDPAGPRAMNVSGQRPVTVQRHWLSGEVHARFSVALSGRRGSSWELVQSGIVVTCGGGVRGGGGMHVSGVTLQVEDLDGVVLDGKDSLGILHRWFGGKRGMSGRKESEWRRRYEEFEEAKRERKLRRMRVEGTLDMLSVGFGVLLFTTLGLYLLCR